MILRPLPWLAAALLLSACAQHPEAPASPDSRIDQFMAGAYQPLRVPVQGWHAEWTLDGEVLEVDWLAPQTGSALPVILYLPGLGEGSGAAEPWRRAWAEAGYAVLAVQPQRHGRGIYASQEAQAGVFHAIAQRAYADEALQRRLRQLGQVLQEARQRAEAGDGDFARIDWTRQAVAGFDLGTQTATALLDGQHGWTPRAAILLSPYAPAPEVAQRISIPLLSATGQADEDPFNWVTPAQRHQLFWQHLEAAGSYQLLLDRMSHAQLGGAFAAGPGGGGRAEGDKPRGRPEGGGAPGGSAGPGMGGGQAGAGGPGGPDGRRGDAGGDRAGYGRGGEAAVDPRQAAALRAVSVAFLDTHVQASGEARTWLEWDANRWLAPSARLEAKNHTPE
ncbi:alpha/beta hydrolase [Phytopseudomonas dryadis]|uniref:Alpha/beta hydrolase n=1 Tax=Phytopseudomonas dryadis TaxID=2487520 RepID=A0ABY1Z3U2_9GAMM|nr:MULTISPECIES: alpha/beta hydrolase [Pseudomonas]TBV02407.1 alpha/beta hydrolase [Pseudomonas dryadis]TBV13614.1 alpha/beta hydrolase [Pseudomonas sp. FRB 230]